MNPAADSTQKSILLTATRLFALKGFDAVGISQICRECEITKPSLYYYFSNKEGLLRAVLEHSRACLEEELEKGFGGPFLFSGDLVRDIEAALGALLRFARRHCDEHVVLTRGFFAGSQSAEMLAARDIFTGLMDLFRHFFASAVSGHGNIQGKEKLLAASLLSQGLTIQSLMMPLESNQDLPADEQHPDHLHRDLIYNIAKNFMYGIFA